MQGEPAAAPSTPAVSKSRPVFVSFPCLARPRLFPGVWPAHGSCTCGGQVARLRRASHAPCLFLPRVSHARAPAAGKSRSGFVSLPNRARTRLVPGARPRMAPVFPGRQESCLLFPAAGQKPAPNFRFEKNNVGPPVPPRTETPEKLSFAPWLFGRFPVSRRFAAERPRKPASSAEEGKNGRRAQASPFAQKRLKS